jgi:histidinol phosphatase-like PHP family hydrolase
MSQDSPAHIAHTGSMGAVAAPADINAIVAGLLSDMAAVQESRQRQWGYRRAATAIRWLETPLEAMVQADGALSRIPNIGPASTRIILEVLATGASPTVERAIDESGRRADIERRRAWRVNFLSHAAAQRVLQQPGHGAYLEYQGDLQMHSTWSDGVQTLDAIVAGCLARGHVYAAVTDHAAGLPVAGGLSMERLLAQARDVDRLNSDHAGRFRLLRGVEANISSNGGLDVEAPHRRQLDLIVAAPHSGLRSALPQTDRMLAAVRSPGVHILGHPRGRMYGSRPGITADWRAVFEAAARSGVAIEIDGDPSRQDLDFVLARQALEAGCLFALDSDAHAVSQLAYVDIAMAHARLAGIPPDRIVNCWPLDRLLEWASSRHGPS